MFSVALKMGNFSSKKPKNVLNFKPYSVSGYLTLAGLLKWPVGMAQLHLKRVLYVYLYSKTKQLG